MKMPRIRMRWTIATLMVIVALCALGLFAQRVIIERAPVYLLIRQLQTGDTQARLQAAKQLGMMGPKAAIAEGALTAALKDPDPLVCREATYALVSIGSKSLDLLPALVADLDIPPPRESTMWFRLGGNDPIAALRMIRPPAAVIVPMLKNVLDSSDRMVRRRAYDFLRELASWSDPASPELATALLEGLADQSFDLRLSAAEGLARLDHTAREEAVARLTGDFRDLDSPRSCEAVLLARLFVPEAQTALAALLDRIRHGDEISRLIGLFLLSQFGEMATPAVPTLVRVMTERDTDRMISWNLQSRWGKRVDQGGMAYQVARVVSDPTTPHQTSAIQLCVRALDVIGEAAEQQAIHDLIEVVQGMDAERTRSAIVALGAFGPKAVEAIPALVDVIRSRAEPSHPGPAQFVWDSHDVSLAALAATSLGQIGSDGNPQVITILTGLLDSDDASLRDHAAFDVSNLGSKAKLAVPALVKALKSPDTNVRRWSAEALARIEGPEVRDALPALQAVLDDENQTVRTNAVKAIGPFGHDAARAVPKIIRVLWDFGPDFGIAKALGQIGPDAAPALPPLIVYRYRASPPGQRDKEIEETLDRILPRTKGATIRGTIAALKASDPAARFRAAYELGRLIEEPPVAPEGVAALGESLKDPDPLVRQMAAAALYQTGPDAATVALGLIRATRDPDDSVRKLAASTLGRITARSEGAVPALAEMMQDPSTEVRCWAADVLGSLGSVARPAVPAMIAALTRQDIPARASILTNLGKLAPADESVVPSLLKALDDPSAKIRATAVEALDRIAGSHRVELVPVMLKVMEDSDDWVSKAAALVLGKIRPQGLVLHALIERLSKGEPQLRRGAAYALTQIGWDSSQYPESTSQVLPVLAAALKDPDPTVRSISAWAIRPFGAAAKPIEAALRAAINDPNRGIRDSASEILRAIADSQRGF
jgi:HEAT repeat protein